MDIPLSGFMGTAPEAARRTSVLPFKLFDKVVDIGKTANGRDFLYRQRGFVKHSGCVPKADQSQIPLGAEAGQSLEVV